MNKICFFFLFIWISIPTFGQTANETLTNDDIVKLSKLELPSAAIISKIDNSLTHFDVSVDALVNLKKQGVAADVVSEMIKASAHEQKVMASHKDMSDPKTMRKTGIYYYNPKDTAALFISVDPTVISTSKSGGFGTKLLQSYTYGISKNKLVSSLAGAESMRRIYESKPIFYFYTNPRTSTSPNEFALVKLKEKSSSRQMTVGTSNAYGTALGIDDDQKIPFGYDKVADGIFKVYLSETLEEGEYCFIYTGSAPTIFSNKKVYDFGVYQADKK